MSIIGLDSKTDPNKILPMTYKWARQHYKDGVANNWTPEEISMYSDVPSLFLLLVVFLLLDSQAWLLLVLLQQSHFFIQRILLLLLHMTPDSVRLQERRMAHILA